jgi:lysophospholipase L1-like esterase
LRTANLGVSGWSTYQGLQQMKKDVVAMDPDVVTIFFGWNDHWKGFGLADKVAANLNSSRLYHLQELRLVQLLGKVVVAFQAEQVLALGTGAGQKRVALPDFRSNLEEMVDVARAHGIKPVLLTAPTTHKRSEAPGYLKKRWLDDLSTLVPLHRSYVKVVRDVARDKGVFLCDLALAFDTMPRDEALTYMKEDGIHFTPEGGVKVRRVAPRVPWRSRPAAGDALMSTGPPA